jgi:ABC-type nitrate/sulfonate/bicarbonate transport system ATPase subunit
MRPNVGNILGNPRAEADRLLTKAFVETSDLRALVETDDFHIIVGRRGTGKSALFERVKGHFEAQTRVRVHAETPREHFALAVQAFLERANHN